MKKLYLLFGLAFLYTQVEAQNGRLVNTQTLQSIPNDQIDLKSNKSVNKKAKAPGAVIYSENFGSGGPQGVNLPLGWTTVDNTGGSNYWLWSNSAPGGQYSGNVQPLNSTTGTNGYLMLPSGLFNTPAPPGGFRPMDAIVTSPAIPINAGISSYFVEFEQYLNYCCSSTDESVLEVSADGVNWDTYDATSNRAPNTPTPNGQLFSIDVSQTLAFEDTAYIRFRQTGPSHYFWMIDDLKLIEGDPNFIETTKNRIVFGDTFQFKPNYTRVPNFMLPPAQAEAIVSNPGVTTQNNVYLHAEYFHDSTLMGPPGVQLFQHDSTLISASFTGGSVDTSQTNLLVIPYEGGLRARIYAKTDSFNQVSVSTYEDYEFFIGDTVIARDRGVLFGGAGPSNYQGGGNDGDRYGSLITVGGVGGYVNSISVYVSTNSSVVGSAIAPMIWEFDQSQSTLSNALSTVRLQGLVPVTITSAMLGTWISLPFTFSTGNNQLIAGKQYVIGWEQISGASSGANFLAGRDYAIEPYSPSFTNFIYLNGNSPLWGWVSVVAGVRANIYPSPVGLSENSTAIGFNMFPNPSNGVFKISSNTDLINSIEVVNIYGELVYSIQLPANKKEQILSLSHLSKGIYFVKVSSNESQLTKKIVLQ